MVPTVGRREGREPNTVALPRCALATGATYRWVKVAFKPSVFEVNSRDDETKAVREWSWIFEKYLFDFR